MTELPEGRNRCEEGLEPHDVNYEDSRVNNVIGCSVQTDPVEKFENGKGFLDKLEPECNGSIVEANPVSIAEFQELQTECGNLRATVLELRRDLQDMQDFIFSLQPRQRRLTETEATEDFNTLCGSIEEWVDRKLGKSLDDRILPQTVCLTPSQRLLALIPHPGKEAFRYPGTDEYNITAAILRFLCDEIFDKEFYCPIADVKSSFMESVEQSMRNLQRDIITCRTWRSETYTAIVNRPEFDRVCERRKEALTRHLANMLVLFISQARARNLESSVRSAIIEPAFALSHKMHLSVDQFSIEWSQYYNLRRDQQKVLVGDFNNFEYVDLNSRKTLKAHSSGDMTYILDITPKLVFRMVKADSYAEPKVLKKPNILVAVSKDGHRHDGESELHSGLDTTILGKLYRMIYPIN